VRRGPVRGGGIEPVNVRQRHHDVVVGKRVGRAFLASARARDHDDTHRLLGLGPGNHTLEHGIHPLETTPSGLGDCARTHPASLSGLAAATCLSASRVVHCGVMGGEPPQWKEHEGRDERAVQARGPWLGEMLGEEWRSDGDGIYRFVASAEPSELEPPAERQLTSTPDAVDALIAELSADLGRR
jgi:hypothetical protein